MKFQEQLVKIMKPKREALARADEQDDREAMETAREDIEAFPKTIDELQEHIKAAQQPAIDHNKKDKENRIPVELEKKTQRDESDAIVSLWRPAQSCTLSTNCINPSIPV